MLTFFGVKNTVGDPRCFPVRLTVGHTDKDFAVSFNRKHQQTIIIIAAAEI